MFALQRLAEGIRHRTRSAARVVGPALLAAVTALSADAQAYSVTNLGLAGATITSVTGVNASGQVFGTSHVSSVYRGFFATRADGTLDIGTLGGPGSLPWGMNASGQLVGASDTFDSNGSPTTHAFSWTKEGGMVDLGTLGGRLARAVAVNDSGMVSGDSQTTDGRVQAFVWTKGGGMVGLPSLGRLSIPLAINASGQVVGYSVDAGGVLHAVLWNPGGGLVDLGTLPGATLSVAEFVTGAGQVVGRFHGLDGDGTPTLHPFVYTPPTGTMDIGTLGGRRAWAVRVNPSGRVIGTSLTATNSNDDTRAFTWTQADGMVPLTFGGASEARDINANGKVVGGATSAGGARRAFSWTQAGGMVDLGASGSSPVAYSVNEPGQVVGQSGLRAFLHEHGSLKDLNDLVTNKPADLELIAGLRIADGGSIVALTLAGQYVLLSPDAAGTAPPVVGQILANDPLPVGATVSASANFTDGASDTHTATWTWGDGTPPQSGTVSEGNGAGIATDSHVFVAAGVYPVTLVVTDNTGLTTNVTRNVVVYDPAAGFVTGSGWLQSPQSAYKPDPAAIGVATFSFVSKYQKGANVPTGTTEFQFHTADLDFRSDTYEWLVVAGARAQFKGIGALNGIDGYRFMLTAVDGKISGGNDRFRIRISRYDADLDDDVVVYDNQVSADTEGTAQEGTVIGGGSIVVHAPKK